LAPMEPMWQNKLWIYSFTNSMCDTQYFCRPYNAYLSSSILLQTQFYAPPSPYFITLILFQWFSKCCH
jgi:hypothetical protein